MQRAVKPTCADDWYSRGMIFYNGVENLLKNHRLPDNEKAELLIKSYAAALPSFDEAIKLDPDHYKSWFAKSQVLNDKFRLTYDIETLAQSVTCMDKALETAERKNLEVLQSSSMKVIKSELLQMMATCKKEPALWQKCLDFTGRIVNEVMRDNEADTSRTKGLLLMRMADCHRNLGALNMDAGAVRNALDCISRATGQNLPDSSRLFTLLIEAECHEALGDMTHSKDEYSTAIMRCQKLIYLSGPSGNRQLINDARVQMARISAKMG